MKLASFKVRGRASFGAVVEDGVVDLKTRLAPRFNSVLDLLRDNGLDIARNTVRGVRADFPLREVEWLPPILTPEKILCIGINYANRNADYGDAEVPKYPSMFFRVPGSLAAHEQPIVRPHESEQLDYEGEIALVIGRGGRRIAAEQALDHVAGVTLCNEGTIRDWMRHGKFNVTQGKNWDSTGSIGPCIVTTDEIDLTRPLHITVKLNGEITQDDTTSQHDQAVRRTDRLYQYFHDAEAWRYHRHRHAGQARPAQRSAGLAEARRRDRDRGAGDRRLAQYGGGGSMSDQHKAACVIAWPAGHSRSPLIHNYWIAQHKLDAEYRREAVPPEQFADFLKSLRDNGYAGANVTVPHKETALALTEPDERARAVGAANTLWFEGDRLRSTNTDVEGFLANLDTATPGWDRGLQSAVVLGAGGGARAAVYALISREVEHIYVVNRTPERIAALRKKFGKQVVPAGWDETTGLLGGAGLAGQHHDARHDRPAAARDQPALPGLDCGGGSCLCAAGHRPASAGARTRSAHRRRARHVVAPGGAGL